MFNSLRTRLFVSYILIILFTLVVIGVALLFVLRTRSLLTEAQSERLYSVLIQIDASRDERSSPLSPDGLTLAQRVTLGRIDKRLNVRILITDASNALLYDSRRGYQPASYLDVDSKPYIPSSQNNPPFPMTSGTLRNPDKSEWLFVAQAPVASATQPLLWVAVPAPRLLNISETFQYYGQNLIIPLSEAGLIGLAVAFVMSLVVTRSIARPLQDVAQAAATAARQLDKPVPVRGPREVRTVAEAFNNMLQQVEETQKAQRDFLANVTHDLRTPLTSIQGFSQAIIDGVASNPGAAQRAAQIIHDEAGRLNRMVQELLDLARIEAGRFSMTRHSIQLSELLLAVGERLTPRAAEKGLTLQVDVPELPLIAGDGDRLVQVYTNLIDNAIKHTPEGGTVMLRAGLQDKGILTQISDTGEGIPAADLPRIFDRFYQVDKSRQRERREGAGLGLPITKGIVEAHGGKLWVQSQEGVGTTFSTWFPAILSDTTTISRRRSGLFKTPAPKPAPERQ